MQTPAVLEEIRTRLMIVWGRLGNVDAALGNGFDSIAVEELHAVGDEINDIAAFICARFSPPERVKGS